MAFISGYKGEKDFITKLKHSISGIPRPKKFRNTADFLPVFISRVTATVRKNSIATPFGKQQRYKQLPVHGLHLSTAL